MPKIVEEERSEKIALNLFDLERLDPWFRQKMDLKRKLDMDRPIKTDWDRVETKDEVALVFTCPLLEAALTCDLIRNYNRSVGDWPVRLYIKKKSWARVPSYRILTVLENGKAALNPLVFPTEIPLAEVTPPEKNGKPILFGRAVKKA